MKTLSCFFTAIYLFTATAHALTCRSLFIDNKPPESSRVEFFPLETGSTGPKLKLEEAPFTQDTNRAVIELIRMLTRNSDYVLEDKNVLTKNKFTLGVPLKDGYVIELAYESKSNTEPRFVLQDKIILVTPTGKKIVIADSLISRDELKLSVTEFPFNDFGVDVKLKVPLVVDGPLLQKFANLAKYFEYFQKDEIMRIFKSDSLLKIETLFQIRRAKSVFYNVLIKEPFKLMIGGTLMFAVFNSHLFLPDHSSVQSVQSAQVNTFNIANTVNKMPIPPQQAALKKELGELQTELAQKVKAHAYTNFNFLDIQIDRHNMFSRENNVFVFERINENTGTRHTYMVFAEDVSKNETAGMKYVVLEVSAAKYKNLIAYIKNQGITK